MLFSSYECNLKHLNKDVGLRLSNFTLPYPIKPYQVAILHINAFKNCKHAIQYIQIWLKGFLSNLFLSTYAININKSMPAWLLPTSLMLPNRLIFYEGLHTPFTNLLINILSSFVFVLTIILLVCNNINNILGYDLTIPSHTTTIKPNNYHCVLIKYIASCQEKN